MQHLGYLSEVSKSSFLAANPGNLRRSHHKLFLLTSHHLGVLISHDAKNSLEKLIILVIAIRVLPWVSISVICFIFLILFVIQIVKISLLLLGSKTIEVQIYILLFRLILVR